MGWESPVCCPAEAVLAVQLVSKLHSPQSFQIVKRLSTLVGDWRQSTAPEYLRWTLARATLMMWLGEVQESPRLAHGQGHANGVARDKRGTGKVNTHQHPASTTPWWDHCISDRHVWVSGVVVQEAVSVISEAGLFILTLPALVCTVTGVWGR